MTRSIRVVVLLGAAVAGSLVWPTEASAQRRVLRAPRARTFVYVGLGRYYYPHWHYSPSYVRPYHPAWYGYAPYHWQRFPPYYGRYDDSASARIQVTPRDTQVYLDGYFVGTVDDFDGYWQRLHTTPGEHELVLYLEGYRTFRQKVLFRPHTTLRISHTMEPLAAGDANEPRPSPAGPPPQRGPVPSRGRDREYGGAPERRGEAAAFGELSLRVQPADAVVTIDGERWDSPEGGSRLQVQLSEGRHHVEVRKDGYRPYTATVEVRRGDTVTLNVSLPRIDP